MVHHSHVMVQSSDNRGLFVCESCAAIVKIIPRLAPGGFCLSAEVLSSGTGGFTEGELLAVRDLWLLNFRRFVGSERVDPA